MTSQIFDFFGKFSGLKYRREQAQLFQNYIKNEKRLKNSQKIFFFQKKLNFFFVIGKSALTDMWIDFFEIFSGLEVSAKAGATFSKLHQN